MLKLIILLNILLFVVFIDVYLRLKHQKILSHIMVASNYYEKLLLVKKIISLDDVADTRKIIKEDLGEKNYEKVKDIFLEHDDEYLHDVENLGESVSKEKRKKIKDLAYHKDYVQAIHKLTNLHRKKIDRYNGG